MCFHHLPDTFLSIKGFIIAGMHFTNEILSAINARGIEIAEVTLHVDSGTFLSIRCETIEDHKMHYECYTKRQEAAELINKAKRDGKEIVVAGTTSMQ